MGCWVWGAIGGFCAEQHALYFVEYVCGDCPASSSLLEPRTPAEPGSGSVQCLRTALLLWNIQSTNYRNNLKVGSRSQTNPDTQPVHLLTKELCIPMRL
jgi:hypothetical protein